MKTRLFTLFALLIGVCSGVQAADEIIFSANPNAAWSVPASTSNAEITSTHATISGGKMYLTNNQSSAKDMIKNQGELAFQHTNNDTFFKIVLNSVLQVGDVISVRMQSRTDTDLGLWLSTATSRPGSAPNTKIVLATAASQAWVTAPTYTVTAGDGLCGENTFYIYRHTGKSTFFNTLKITRPNTKTISSKVLTGININGASWDIAGLSGNAATITTDYTGFPTIDFIYTINYDDSSTETDQKETVIPQKSGDNYVAASTELTTNVTLTFTSILPYIFNMTDVTGPTSDITHGTGDDVTANFNGIANTSAYVYNGHGSNDQVKLVIGNEINLNSSGNSYFKASFAIALAEGDIINCSNKTASTFKIGTSSTSSSATGITFPYTIPSESDFIGKNSIYVFKVGGTPTLTSFSIARYPKHHVTYAVGEGTGTAPTETDKAETSTFTLKNSTGITAPAGKMFKCWNDGTADYLAGATYTMGTLDVTFTAVYESAITATFHNGGHGTAPTAQNAGTIVLPSINADWYDNNAWVADVDVTVDDATVKAGTAIIVGKTVTISENTTFTAQWTYTGKPYIEGITLPTPAVNALNMYTQSLFTSSGNYVVINPNDVRGNSTQGYWLTASGGNKAGFTWSAPEGSVFTSAETSTNCITLQVGRTYAIKFTGTTEFKALMNSRKSGKTVKALLVDYAGAIPEKVSTIEIGPFTSGSPIALSNNSIASFSNLDASHTYVAFFYGFDTSTNGVIYQIALKQPTISGTITASGYNTFSSNSALNLSTITGATAYIATSVTAGKVILTKCTDMIEAGTGILLSGEPNTEFSINTYAGAATFASTNLFIGLPNGGTVTAANNTSEFNYVFGWTDVSNPGFYLVNTTDATLTAGKAYLHTTEALGGTSARLALIFEDAEATGIADIRSNISNARSEIFDLQGRHIAQPTKGLYIKNGKKIIVK